MKSNYSNVTVKAVARADSLMVLFLLQANNRSKVIM